MTTNAVDWLDRQVSSDSRWSYEMSDNEFLFVDDASYDKLAVRGDICLVFAGSGLLIEWWKVWFHDPAGPDEEKMPPTNLQINDHLLEASICMISTADGAVLFDDGMAIRIANEARFSGSGSRLAADCWKQNKCVKTAVGTACSSDPHSGGETKFLVLGTGSNNLSPVTAESLSMDTTVYTELQKRGFHMDKVTNIITPIAEHQGAQDWLKKCAGSLQLVASAPIGGQVNWTEEKRAELKAAFRSAKETGKL